MQFKTSCALALTAAMLLGAVTPAYAALPVGGTAKAVPMIAVDPIASGSGGTETPVDAKISRERAIELAKQFVTVPDDYKLQNVSYQSYIYAGGGRGSWSLGFTKQDKNRYYGSINVSIDAETGKLLSYYLNTENDRKPVFPPKVQLEEAGKIALDYIGTTVPELKDQVRYDDSFAKNYRPPLGGPVQYPVTFYRMVNGVVFPQNFISVTVNDEGKVISYNQQWDDSLTFPSTDGVISLVDAGNRFKAEAAAELQYTIPYSSQDKPEPLLIYQLNPFTLDGKSGDVLLPDGSKRKTAPQWIPISEKPLAEPPASSLKLTKEQAVERAASLLPLPKDAKLEDASYRENTDPRTGVTRSEWSLRWSSASEKDKGKPDMNAVLDSDTGAILQYSKYDYRPMQADASTDVNGTLSTDDLRNKAIEYIKQWMPDQAHELYYSSDTGLIPEEKLRGMTSLYFNFRRMVGGAFTDYDSVNVSLDRKTGELQSFQNNLSSFSYPAELPKIISADDAKSQLLSQYKVELQYMIDSKGSGNMLYYGASLPVEKYNVLVASGEIKPDAKQTQMGSQLVYVLKPSSQFRGSVVLDAVTGQWKNRDNGQVVNPIGEPPTDIKGHWAENALLLMTDYQALDVKDGKVRPDELITRGEMVKMLLLSLNGGYEAFSAGAYADRAASFSDVAKSSPYFAYVENALDRGLIDRSSVEFQPDATLTRAELAGLIVRALGYRKLAQVDGLFANTATDLDGVTNTGDIALVSALHIMSQEDGKFSPGAQVTRAGAAAAFYKFLQVRLELQDTPNRAG